MGRVVRPAPAVPAPDGTPVNAIRGLLDMIARLVRARHPARLVACLDADWRPAFRVAAIPSYKAHRAQPDGDAAAQREVRSLCWSHGHHARACPPAPASIGRGAL